MSKKCIFCRILSGEKPEIYIAENEKFVTLLDIEQKGKAHSIIILREHHKSVEGMDDQDWSLVLPILKETVGKIDKCYHPLGYNFHTYSSEKEGLHLQSVPHFHLHIVPLWEKHYGHNWSVTRMHKVGNDGKISQLPPTLEEYKKTYENVQGKKKLYSGKRSSYSQISTSRTGSNSGSYYYQAQKEHS